MRSFISIELPEETRNALSRVQKEFEKCSPDIRWVKPGNIHLTLKFLGNIEDEIAENITVMMRKVCSKFPSFILTLQGAGMFPNVRSPRVLWIGLNGNDVLAALQKEIEDGLEPLGFKSEKRKFTPHLTLGRFRSSIGKDCLRKVMERQATNRFGTIKVLSVALMRSDLHPSGARYTKISEAFLSGSG
ncbi:MAG: RNA 2',3'-cyclic phosphodiesterase [Nitrospiraceae bacterium]|nr:MAG: RNA 2',3'-cyclic phosphodiesterase [Nitrospiraceae bacterium]